MKQQSKIGLLVAATVAGVLLAAGVTADIGDVRNLRLFHTSKAQEGRTVFVQVCGACHASDPNRHKIGPSLFGVVGRPAGSLAGFGYSDAMKGAALTWNDETLDRYLADPKSFVRGNRMPYSLLMGATNAERRDSVIAYLHTLE
jgi:cytochrome c